MKAPQAHRPGALKANREELAWIKGTSNCYHEGRLGV
jgi:hypothetical protein